MINLYDNMNTLSSFVWIGVGGQLLPPLPKRTQFACIHLMDLQLFFSVTVYCVDY